MLLRLLKNMAYLKVAGFRLKEFRVAAPVVAVATILYHKNVEIFF